MKWTGICLAALFGILMLCCRSSADGTRSPNGDPQDTTLVGTVYVSGNEPFVILRLDAGNNEHPELRADSVQYRALWQLQGRRVDVTGPVERSPLGTIVRVKRFHVLE